MAGPDPPVFSGGGSMTVEEALQAGPQSFRGLMDATGSDDDREVVRALEPFYAAGRLERLDDGRYVLK